LQLAAQTIGDDTISQDCINLLADAYNYCSDSPQRVAALKAFQDATDTVQLKLLKLSSVSNLLMRC
jgi:hypothetical protein